MDDENAGTAMDKAIAFIKNGVIRWFKSGRELGWGYLTFEIGFWLLLISALFVD